ncbi:unnamed protein product [Polarella glacialis]|uniref:Glycosyl transferase CAP10 domain-containing protein n=1 Tax=Polarella glacialis TaxID=89957 RepID=A0A813H3V3_POLGL|nr:unnamed protein product [Polarella glacialis]
MGILLANEWRLMPCLRRTCRVFSVSTVLMVSTIGLLVWICYVITMPCDNSWALRQAAPARVSSFSGHAENRDWQTCKAAHQSRNEGFQRLPEGLENYTAVVDYWFARAGFKVQSIDSKELFSAVIGSNYSHMSVQDRMCILVQIVDRRVFVMKGSFESWLGRGIDSGMWKNAGTFGRLYGSLLYVQYLVDKDAKLPEFDFILCAGDDNREHDVKEGLPYFAPTSSHSGRYAIPFPIRERNFGRSFMLDFWPMLFQGLAESAREKLGPLWRDRTRSPAVWRGTVYFPWGTRGNRVALLRLSEMNHTLMDARGPYVVKGKLTVDSATNKTVYHPNPEYEQWKYQLSIGGNGGWADRLLEDSFRRMTILHVDEGSVDFWWPTLRAFEHYVPIDPGLVFLFPCIRGLQAMDAAAEKIAGSMRQKALDMLSPQAIDQYSLLALHRMAGLMKRRGRRRQGSMSVPQFYNWIVRYHSGTIKRNSR